MKTRHLSDAEDEMDVKVDTARRPGTTLIEVTMPDGNYENTSSYLSLEDAARLHFWLGALLQREVSGG